MYKIINEEYHKLDQKIRKLLFPDSKIRNYSFDRRLAACIVEKIMMLPKNIIDEFNKDIHSQFAIIFNKSGAVPRYDEFILSCCPDDICRAAIHALFW